MFMDLGMELAKHGEIKKEERHNFWKQLFSKVILLGLLYWGGFFNGLF